MTLGKLAVLGIALMFASAGVGAALADWRSSEPGPPIDLADARKDESADVAAVEDDDEDDDDTNGNDRGDNTPVQRAGDGDDTRGDDGTSGGDNTTEAPRAPAPAPAPAPVDDSVSAHSGGGDSGSGGGGDT